MLDYNKLPEILRREAQAWIEKGTIPGAFQKSILHNDLKGAVLQADVFNLRMLAEIVLFWHHEAPIPCWGSVEKVKAWAAHAGFMGLEPAKSTGREEDLFQPPLTLVPSK